MPVPAGAGPAAGADGHLTIYQPSTDTLWELWKALKAPDGWHARWGGKMTGVSTSPGYFPPPLGATGTSLPLLGGLMRISELTSGRVDHALALGIPNARAGAYVWPAQRGDGTSTSATAIPEGTRLRLDPAVNVDMLGLSAVGRQMALAAQRYGIVIRDMSGAVSFYAEDPTPTGRDPYPALFRGRSPDRVLDAFPWGRLEVLAVPSPAAPGPAPPPAAPPLAAPPPPPAAHQRAPVTRRSKKNSKRSRSSRRCARRTKSHPRRKGDAKRRCTARHKRVTDPRMQAAKAAWR